MAKINFFYKKLITNWKQLYMIFLNFFYSLKSFKSDFICFFIQIFVSFTLAMYCDFFLSLFQMSEYDELIQIIENMLKNRDMSRQVSLDSVEKCIKDTNKSLNDLKNAVEINNEKIQQDQRRLTHVHKIIIVLLTILMVPRMYGR